MIKFLFDFIKLFKKLFKKQNIIVYTALGPKKFKSFEAAAAYMLSKNR